MVDSSQTDPTQLSGSPLTVYGKQSGHSLRKSFMTDYSPTAFGFKWEVERTGRQEGRKKVGQKKTPDEIYLSSAA